MSPTTAGSILVATVLAATAGITAQQIKTGAPSSVTYGASAAEGASQSMARADHAHPSSGFEPSGNYSGIGSCGADQFVTAVNDTATPTCAQPTFGGLGGTVADSQLASNYSGVGACGANTWASTLNDNAAPTCTQPAFSNLSGAATIAQGGTTETASTEDAVLVGSGTTDWQPKALPACNTTTSKLLYDTATNSFSCGTDQTGGSSASEWFDPTNNRVGIVQPGSAGSATLVAMGMTLPTGLGGSPQLDSAVTERLYVRYQTSNTAIGTVGPFSGGSNDVRSTHRPVGFRALIRTSSDTTDQRVQVGLVESNAVGTLACSAGPTASTVDQVTACWDATLGGAWKCCTGDGGNYSCVDITGSTYVAGTPYYAAALMTSTGAQCWVQAEGGTEYTITKTTNITTSALHMSIFADITNTVATSARLIYFARGWLRAK